MHVKGSVGSMQTERIGMEGARYSCMYLAFVHCFVRGFLGRKCMTG